MTPFKKKILIVDDQVVNRMLLKKILSEKYDIFEAPGGEEALEILKENKDVIQVILLDLVMPGMDGYTFLSIVKEDPELRNVPIIVTTQSEGVEAEIKALELGASDYITKPYNNVVILQRVTNIIAFRENAILRNTAERDPLTGLYNKATFFVKVNELLVTHPETEYAILYMDIERFKMVNDFFGEKEGDKLLNYIAHTIGEYADAKETVCARYSADIFVVCMPHDPAKVMKYADILIEQINKYPLNFRISVNFGVYVIEDRELPIHVMCDRASLALEHVVGKYDCFFAYYDDKHLAKLKEEQDITNEMTAALREEQFHVYLQPKFNMADFSIVGAEALVRWIHPTKGFIGPDKFIPVFERNGFITELDVYIWRKTCSVLKEWKEKGWNLIPISVNVSRVDIYRPDICDVFSNMMEEFDLPTHLLELEITETAYTQNADQLIETVSELKKRGFTLSMDDFGSGYSSLNMLNEVPVDVLKIDMTLLRNLDLVNKGNNIINFVVSMAKWLKLPVISEGVETIEQVNFLRSIGCYTGQGYFFSKPLPIEKFEELLLNQKREDLQNEDSYSTFVSVEDIWDPNSQFNIFFESFVGSYGLFEWGHGSLRFLRGNEQFYQKVMGGQKESHFDYPSYVSIIAEKDLERVQNTVTTLCDTRNEMSVEYEVHNPDIARPCWHKMTAKVLYSSQSEHLFLACLEDITHTKQMEFKTKETLEEIKSALSSCNVSFLEFDLKTKSFQVDAYGQQQYGLPETFGDANQFFTENEIVLDTNKEEMNAFFNALLRGERHSEIFMTVKNTCGQVVRVKMSYHFDTDVHGKAISATCLIQKVDLSKK